MSELLNIPGILWQDLGTRTDPECTTIDSLIKKSGANYTVSAYKMYTEVTNSVEGYHAIYRNDDKRLMCVVNNFYPEIVQNDMTFAFMKPLMAAGLVSLEFVSVAAGGMYHYGVFKSNKTYKILDEDIEHYFLVVNDHSKPDGKVAVYNLPVRKKNKTILLCSMTNSAYKLRMPVSEDEKANEAISSQIMSSVDDAFLWCEIKLKKLHEKAIELEEVTKVIDELFPYVSTSDGEILDTKANEKVDELRSTFQECIDSDDNDQYRQTALYLYFGMLDYTQHYWNDAGKGYDINKKMTIVPGFFASIDTEGAKVGKLMKMIYPKK